MKVDSEEELIDNQDSENEEDEAWWRGFWL